MIKLINIVGAGVLCAILLSGATVAAESQKSGEVELISGEVVSLWNYMARDERGEEHAGHGIRIVEKGLPIAIVTDEGQIYVATLEGGKSAAKKLLPLMGMMVNAQGPVHRKAGTNLIEIQVVSEQ